MPDISMCMHTTCEARKRCHRHAESGTKPSEYRQAYSTWGDEAAAQCEGFWPKTERSLPPKREITLSDITTHESTAPYAHPYADAVKGNSHD